MIKDGNIAPEMAELASGFDGPLALFSCASDKMHAAPVVPQPYPVCPSMARRLSRRAAEIAFAVARATGARVSALFVSQTDGRSRTRSREEGGLKDMTRTGRTL